MCSHRVRDVGVSDFDSLAEVPEDKPDVLYLLTLNYRNGFVRTNAFE